MRRVTICVLAVIAAAAALDARQQPPADGWVVLTLDDYRMLRSRAFPQPPDPSPPPVDAAVTRIDYDLRVGPEVVSGEARLTLDVLKDGWVSVLVPPGLLVRSARMDGRPTALIDGAPPRLLVSGTGRSTLALEVVVPLTTAGGAETISLPRSGSAVSAVTLVVPREGVDLAVTGGFIGEQTSSPTEGRWVVYGTPSQATTMTWKRRVDDRRATLPLKMRARITELVALGEESTAITAGARIEVVQGAAREVVLSMPGELAVNQVAGATVADWRHAPGQLTVSFLEPVTSEASFTIGAEVHAPGSGAMAIPILRVPAADRETGGIAVEVVGAGEIDGTQHRGMDAADASEVGDVVAGRESPSMIAFRFMPLAGSAPRSLTVTLSRYAAEAVLVANVEEARYDALVGEDGKMLVRARYAVRNNQRSFLAVSLPAGATLWSAKLGGWPVRPGIGASGSLLLPLQKGRAGQDAPVFAVELVYLRRADAWQDRGVAAIELPAVDLPVSRTGLNLRYSPRFTVDVRPGTFRRDDDVGPWTAVLVDRAAPPPPAMPAESASQSIRGFLDRYRREGGRTAAGIVPLDVEVPAFGSAVFLAAELTAEGRVPVVELDYRRSNQ